MLRRFVRSLRTTAPATQGRAPAVEALEKRELMAVSPVFAGTKIKGVNLSSNGISTNQTLITVPFTGNINIADASKIQLRGYALNPLSSKLGQVKKVVNVVKAEVLASDHSYLQITTDRLMRKGGQIIFYEGALKDDNGDTLAAQTVKTVKGQNKERFTLACRAFIPTDFTRFDNSLFAASPVTTPQGGTVDQTTATTNLTTFLNKKVALGIITQAKADAAVARFSAAATKGTIPDHNLRSALFALTGTFAEGAIASILDGANVTGKPYTIIAFQTPTDPTVEMGQTSARPSDGRLRTIFRPEFSGEHFLALSAFIGHEALHQDNTFTLEEEEVANTFGTLIAAQQAQVDSSFLKTPTKLVNQLINPGLLAMINSGKSIFPYVGSQSAPMMLNAAGGVFQGQKPDAGDGHGVFISLQDYIKREYLTRGAQRGETAGNALLNQYYNAVTGKTASATMKFSEQIVADIDSFQSPIGIKGAITIAQALRLKLS